MSLGSWLPDRVVHVRSYSKSHGPDLRIAALGGPSAIVDRIVARRMLGPAWTSRMVQTILLDLLTSSQSLDEVAEARRQYMARQRTLVGALGDLGVDTAAPDGINLWLPVQRRAGRAGAPVGVGHPGGRRVTCRSSVVEPGRPASFVRVTSGLVSPQDARRGGGRAGRGQRYGLITGC